MPLGIRIFVLCALSSGSCAPGGGTVDAAPRESGSFAPPAAPVAPAAASGAPSQSAGRTTALGYGWTSSPGALEAVDSLRRRFSAPAGFEWAPADVGSFGAYLGELPLAPRGTPVLSYRGAVIATSDDPRVAAVSTLDVGTRDLQQCADAVLRLRAEYEYARGADDALSYRAASGFPMPFARWLAGERPVLRGRDLAWVPSRATQPRTHEALRSWLDVVFEYANTVSIARDAVVPSRLDVKAGDFFVQGGSPGHAVLVLGLAVDARGRKRALLGQSYMPAQSFHVLAVDSNPWFSLDGDSVQTPFWRSFGWSDLRRFR